MGRRNFVKGIARSYLAGIGGGMVPQTKDSRLTDTTSHMKNETEEAVLFHPFICYPS